MVLKRTGSEDSSRRFEQCALSVFKRMSFLVIIIISLIFFPQGYKEKDKYIASQGMSVLSMFHFLLKC